MLDLNEIKIIEDSVGKLREKIILSKEPFLDLTQFEENLFEDFNYQKKFFNDKEKITLYYSLVNTGGRRTLVTKPTYLTIIAYLFSIFVRIYHIPRMLKLKFFPGLGQTKLYLMNSRTKAETLQFLNKFQNKLEIKIPQFFFISKKKVFK